MFPRRLFNSDPASGGGVTPGESNPPANNDPQNGTPPAAPTSAAPSTPPSPPANPNEPKIDSLPDWAQRIIGDLRKENAGHRTEKQQLQSEVEEFKRRDMTELDRYKSDVTKLTTEVVPEKDRMIRELQVQVASQSLGVVDPDAVVKFLDWSKVDAGTPITQAINELLEAKPYLKAAAPVTQPPVAPTAPPSQSSPASPSGGGNSTPQAHFTRSQLASMSVAEFEKNREAIHDAMQNGRVKND